MAKVIIGLVKEYIGRDKYCEWYYAGSYPLIICNDPLKEPNKVRYVVHYSGKLFVIMDNDYKNIYIFSEGGGKLGKIPRCNWKESGVPSKIIDINEEGIFMLSSVIRYNTIIVQNLYGEEIRRINLPFGMYKSNSYIDVIINGIYVYALDEHKIDIYLLETGEFIKSISMDYALDKICIDEVICVTGCKYIETEEDDKYDRKIFILNKNTNKIINKIKFPLNTFFNVAMNICKNELIISY